MGRSSQILGQINEEYMGRRPGGYLTPEDTAFGESLRSRGTEIIESGAKQRLSRVKGGLAQRGMLGGGLELQAESESGAGADVAKAALGGEVGDVMHRLYSANRLFEQGKVNSAYAARVRNHEINMRRDQARQAGWWGSASRLLGATIGLFGGGPLGAIAGATISPAAGDPVDWAPTPEAPVF